MARRDENLMASAAVAGFALVMLLALVGALFLPPGINATLFTGRWPFAVSMVLFFVGVPVLLRVSQRSRIRRAVTGLGGTLVKLRRLPFWRQGEWPESYQSSYYGYPWWRGVLYEVEFVDLLGGTRNGICRSGFLRGVQWLDESQPKGRSYV